MPVISALCKKSCWDNVSGTYFYQGQNYPVDTDSPVGKLENVWHSNEFRFPSSRKAVVPVIDTIPEAAPPSAPAVKAASAVAAKKP